MGFVKTQEEIDRYYSLAVREFPGAQMLGLMYQTDPAVIKHLLPPPLEPAAEPWAMAYIARFPDTNLGPGYREGGLFIRCQYQGEVGNHCLSMPLDGGDDRIFNGRDIYGFPKSRGLVSLTREGDEVSGFIERHGVRFVTLRAKLMSRMKEPPLKVGPTFLFKFLPAANLQPGFDSPVHLVRQRTEIAYESFEMGTGEILFENSPHDPWGEVPCKQVLAAYFFTSTNRMFPGELVGQADPATFLPYAFARTDWGFVS